MICDILSENGSIKTSKLLAGRWLYACGCVLPIYAAGWWKSWRSIAGIALKSEIGSLAQIKNVISLVAGICKHGVDLARCGEEFGAVFPNHFSQILSDWVT